MINLENLPARLSRAEASEYLKQIHGISRTPATLAKIACVRSDGPAFRRIGTKQVSYDVAELDRWANEIIGTPRRSTSAAA